MYLRCVLFFALWCACTLARAQIPAAVDAELARAKLPRDAVALLVVDAQNPIATPRLSHRVGVPMQAASVIKLVTTFASLELLGPAYTWNTPVYMDGALRAGVLAPHPPLSSAQKMHQNTPNRSSEDVVEFDRF